MSISNGIPERRLRIAYIGPAAGNSLHRAQALARLGHSVTVVDPWHWLGPPKWAARWIQRTGGIGAGLWIGRRLDAVVARVRPELIFVSQGEFLGPSVVSRLRRFGAPIVSYTNDNPFSPIARRRFLYYRQALPYYDLATFIAEASLATAKRHGARHVMHVWLTADERAHRPRSLSAAERVDYSSEVAFVGSWLPERGPFMAELIRRGVPVSIWGDRWQKAREWNEIAPHYRGPGVYVDDGYRAIIQSAKVCLGLLSKQNENLHTSRSIEIPAIGGVLCAERTAEHLALYEEDREAVYWQDAAECAAQCDRLLADDGLRAQIARSGRERAMANNLFNEPMLSAVIARALEVFNRPPNTESAATASFKGTLR